jgi:hypothetical protein
MVADDLQGAATDRQQALFQQVNLLKRVQGHLSDLASNQIQTNRVGYLKNVCRN